MVARPEDSEVKAAEDEEQEAVSHLLNLADRLIELSQQERQRLTADVEAPETQENLQDPV